MRVRTRSNQPLHKRLRPGRGALVQHGEYWYPVRLIQRLQNKGKKDKSKTQWRVRWWRGCQFAVPGVKPDSITVVEEEKIVDSLWNDREGRRKIRVSQLDLPL